MRKPVSASGGKPLHIRVCRFQCQIWARHVVTKDCSFEAWVAQFIGYMLAELLVVGVGSGLEHVLDLPCLPTAFLSAIAVAVLVW